MGDVGCSRGAQMQSPAVRPSDATFNSKAAVCKEEGKNSWKIR